ncbi:PLP-dependent aminotransferase family protein [Aquabacterium sp.]|uniref:aminotransferase-like domain-containing protein n=1 Tax=Aquabacterium sp. TaxID=1872578 RepID=UPI0027B9B4A6|nr:PLP-dependent aminotransferase family protein [Aquabacterium sp.]
MSTFMKHWAQRLRASGKPAYLLIPELLAEDVASGRLTPGDRLPPLRDLANALGLNYTTLARAMAEAQKRGQIDARPGRGSFVRSAAPAMPLRGGGAAEMTMNLPPEPTDPQLLSRMAEGCKQMYEDPRRLLAHLRYQDFGGSSADRDAGARWLNGIMGATSAERVLVGPGIHGILCGLMSLLARPGDTVCVESVSYPGIKALATQLGVKLHALPVDQDGICPQHFEEACKHVHPKALYCNPTMLNPTSVTMSPRRREALADIALRYAVPIIEDDAYGALPAKRPTTLAELAPELTYHVTGFAKCLGAGLRVAYVHAPTVQATQRLAGAMRALTVMAAPPTVSLATQWINDGTASLVVQAIRKETNVRQALLSKHLSNWEVWSQPDCFHAWLQLPETLSPNEAAAFWRSRGVAAVASTAFATNTAPPRAVRLCLGGATTASQCEQSLRVVADVLRHPQQVHASVM